MTLKHTTVFPQRKHQALTGKSYTLCWKQSLESCRCRQMLLIPAGSSESDRMGWAEFSPKPLLRMGCNPPPLPTAFGANTFHACCSWEVIFLRGLKKIHFSFIQHLFIATEKLPRCCSAVRYPHCLWTLPVRILQQQRIWEQNRQGTWHRWAHGPHLLPIQVLETQEVLQLLQSNRK